MDGSSFLAAFAAENAAIAGASCDPKSGEEVIHFKGVVDRGVDSFPVKGSDVSILPSPGDHEVGSSKLKITNVVNFGWEHRYYSGQLVATDKLGQFMAYGIFSAGQQTGVVRVVHRQTEERVLLKGMQGKIEDLAFSHTLGKNYLAVVDSHGTLFVFSIKYEEGGKLKTEVILEIRGRDYNEESEEIKRVIWCPYLPEDDESIEDDTNSRILVSINGAVAEIWSTDMIIKKYGKGVHESDDIDDGKLVIDDHTEPVSDASFSPDGTALATASLDGQVKFFQVYMYSKEPPRCLHQWSPHGGKPVSCLFFLDNHRNYNPEVQFWKYAVTGADNNSELKIWSCESWSCIQTVRFQAPMYCAPLESAFKPCLDLSARFLLLSDIHRRNVYALQLDCPKDASDSHTRVVSVSEFATPSAFLSMSVMEAGVKKVSELHAHSNDDGSDDSSDSEDESAQDRNQREATFIKFLLVQPKSIQECSILYDDAFSRSGFEEGVGLKTESKDSEIGAPSVSVTSASPMPIRMKKEEPESTEKKLLDLKEAADKITLMSPEVFTTRKKVKKEPVSPGGLSKSKKDPAGLLISALASGGSSPSGEVQNILADSEENGGLATDVVFTEEDIESEVDDEESQVEEDEDYNEDAEFEGLDEKVAAMKKDIGKDILDVEGLEEEVGKTVDPLANLVKTLNISSSAAVKPSGASGADLSAQQDSAWQALIAKQEANGQQQAKTLNRSFEIKSELPASLNLSAGPIFPPAPVPMNISDPNSQFIQIHHQLQTMSKTMSEMASLIQMQRSEIKILREELRTVALEDRPNANLNQLLEAHTSKLRDGFDKDRKLTVSSLSQVVNNAVAQKLEALVKKEAKRIGQDVLKQTAANFQQQLNNEVSNRLAKSDQALRDSIGKMAHSKACMETLGNALAASITPVLQNSFRETFASVIVPSFERSLQNLFATLSATFTKGTKEYEATLRNHITRAVSTQLEPVVKELKVSGASLNVDFEKFKDTLVMEMRSIIMQGQRTSPSTISLASLKSPETKAITQMDIANLLRAGAFNDAFHAALSQKNVPLVVMTCEMVNPTQIFGQTPCPLTQNVLLSLIQHLSQNLYDKTEVKLKYLEEAVMNLDTNAPDTARHVESIAQLLMVKLQEFVNQNPQEKFVKNMKMLMMATKALVPQGK